MKTVLFLPFPLRSRKDVFKIFWQIKYFHSHFIGFCCAFFFLAFERITLFVCPSWKRRTRWRFGSSWEGVAAANSAAAHTHPLARASTGLTDRWFLSMSWEAKAHPAQPQLQQGPWLLQGLESCARFELTTQNDSLNPASTAVQSLEQSSSLPACGVPPKVLPEIQDQPTLFLCGSSLYLYIWFCMRIENK